MIGNTPLSLAFRIKLSDLRRSCADRFLVFPTGAAQTDRLTDRQRVTSHCSAWIRFVLHGPRFRHFMSQFHCLLIEMGSTQHCCLSVSLSLSLIFGLFSFFVSSIFGFVFPLCEYVPSYFSFLRIFFHSFYSVFFFFL